MFSFFLEAHSFNMSRLSISHIYTDFTGIRKVTNDNGIKNVTRYDKKRPNANKINNKDNPKILVFTYLTYVRLYARHVCSIS